MCREGAEMENVCNVQSEHTPEGTESIVYTYTGKECESGQKSTQLHCACSKD